MTDRREGLFSSVALHDLLGDLGGRTDAVWLIGNTIGLGLTLCAALAVPQHGLFFAYLAVLARIALYAHTGAGPRGRYFALMLRLGLVAGVLEILADYMLVRWLPTGKLIYLSRDAVLLESPLYMPLAWACVIVEFGYVPLRLFGMFGARGAPSSAQTPPSSSNATGVSIAPGTPSARIAPGTPSAPIAPGTPSAPIASSTTLAAISMVVGGLVAGVSIGLYEFFAFRAGWWKYEPARVMIGPYCAAFIPAGECLMFLGILPIFASMVREPDPERRGAIVAGAAFAALIFVAYALAYLLIEGLPR